MKLSNFLNHTTYSLLLLGGEEETTAGLCPNIFSGSSVLIGGY